MIRLLLVDDHPLMRTGLRMLLATEADLLVVGEAEDGQGAIDLAATLGPDVVLMDVEMPCMDGVTATGKLHQELPQIAIIVLTLYDSAEMRARALDAGAAAFVSKFTPTDELLITIRQIAGGCGPAKRAGEE
jgi:DNA-binding NarL/FixJ family response regulator